MLFPRLLSQRCCHSLVYRFQCSKGYCSAIEENHSPESLAEPSNELDTQQMESRAQLVANAMNAMDKDGVRLKPPGSHESPSLLYDPVTSKFINMLMRDGKKSQAQRVFMQALELIKRTQIAKDNAARDKGKVVVNPITVVHQAIENAKPVLGTKVVKKSGKAYHVPCSLTDRRRTFLACKWLITSAREKRGIGVAKKLAIDFIDSYNHKGYAIKKKQDLHRLADANRAYVHFRW